MDPVLVPIASALRLHTRLFHNCLEGIGDEDARRRPSGRTNSMAFIALHMVDARHLAARTMGAEAPNPFASLLQDARGIDNVVAIPPLTEIRDAWDQVSAALEARLQALAPEELAAPPPQPFPADDPTLAGAIAFLATHDAYHVGQLALLRKLLGFDPMRYT
jgi:uncharacterized damage-inducible protein DinB